MQKTIKLSFKITDSSMGLRYLLPSARPLFPNWLGGKLMLIDSDEVEYVYYQAPIDSATPDNRLICKTGWWLSSERHGDDAIQRGYFEDGQFHIVVDAVALVQRVLVGQKRGRA